MITGFIAGVTCSLVFAIAIYLCVRVMDKERKQRLSKLIEASNKSLAEAVSELMARANEVDQETKYLQKGSQPEVSERLGQVCKDLVVLGDAVNVINKRIEQKQLDSAKTDLLISLGAASKISSEINDIRKTIRQKSNPD